MATYIAVVHGEPGNYGISIPDFPGCTSGGRTIDEALARIRLAASDWMDAMTEDNHPVPPPRTLETLRADPEYAVDFDGPVAVAAIDLDPPGRVVRLAVTMDEGLLGRVDRAATTSGESRSGWLAAAARLRLAQERAESAGPGRAHRAKVPRRASGSRRAPS